MNPWLMTILMVALGFVLLKLGVGKGYEACEAETRDELAELRLDRKRLEYITDGYALLKDMTGESGTMVGYTVISLETEEFAGSGKTKREAIDTAMEEADGTKKTYTG